MKRYKIIMVPVLCAAAVFLLLRFFFIFGYVPTESMEPTLEKGSYILGVRIYGELKTGDIVIFEHEGRLLVKRIAGSPGEMVEHNGQSVLVPENSFYMLGDKAANSFDSRFWETPFISRRNVVARLI